MATENVRPWERRDDESPEAFEAFDTYLRLGVGRSLAKVGQILGKDKSLLERWSSPVRHDWVSRVRAHDRFESRQITEQVIAGKARMRERIAIQGQNLQSRAANRLLAMSDADLAKLTPREMVAMVKAGVDLEERARDIGADELGQMERDDAPSFTVQFLDRAPEEMVSVRLPDGTVGYIPPAAIDALKADHPGAVVIA